jgi:thiol-disulfide isomerase/thioredoxin
MRFLIFCSLSFLTSFCTQTHLKIHNSDLDTTSINIYTYTNYILPSRQIVAENIELSKADSYEIKLNTNQPEMVIIRYDQPNQSYDIFLTKDGIAIESEDKINETLERLSEIIDHFNNELFEIESEKSDDMRFKIMSKLSDLKKFHHDNVGTDFQNQLIEYQIAMCNSLAFQILKDQQGLDSLESVYLLKRKKEFNNPEYLYFLFDYYWRRFMYYDLRRQTYADDLGEMEIIKKEVNFIADDTVKQLALFYLARKAYNAAWDQNNDEIIEIFDDLAIHGLHHDIRQSSEALSSRYRLLSKGAKLPDLTFADLTGNTINLSEFQGKYVLLDFWFIGCKPCQADVPYLKKLYGDFNACLEIVSINPRDDFSKIMEYKTHEGHEWSFLKSDLGSEAMDILQVNFFPTYFLLDPDGRILLSPSDISRISSSFNKISQLIQDDCEKSSSAFPSPRSVP